MKKFFLKLKNIFKNKKFCALIIISVFTLSTLGIGIGVLTHALINAGGGFFPDQTGSEASGYWETYCSNSSLTNGSGTKTNPYKISTANQLASLIYNVDYRSGYSTAYYVLTTDISLSEHYWTPIGQTKVFSGCIDGQGHTITGLTLYSAQPYNEDYNVRVDGNRTNHYFAFIGCAQDAIIKNLNFQDVSITTASVSLSNSSTSDQRYYKYACIVASAPSNVQIANCHVDNISIRPSFYASSSYDYSEFWVGGLVAGAFSNCAISNCSVTNADFYFSGGNTGADNSQCVGGLVGRLDASKIQESSFSCSNFHIGTVGTAGLIAGRVGSSGCVIEDTYATTTYKQRGDEIYVNSYFFGGITGDGNGGCIIRRCYVYNGGGLNCRFYTSLCAGLVGETSCRVVSCYVDFGNYTTTNSSSSAGTVGGIVGITYSGAEVYSNYYYAWGSSNSIFNTSIANQYDGSASRNYSITGSSMYYKNFYTSISYLAGGLGIPWDFDYTWTEVANTLPTLRGSNIGSVSFYTGSGTVNQNLIEGDEIASSGSGTNMSYTYTPSTGSYVLTNTSNSNPYVAIQATAYLTANTTYSMHVRLSTVSGSGVRIYYGTNNSFTDTRSLVFTSTDSSKTFTPTTTGTYNFRFDNDTNTTVTVSDFYVVKNTGATDTASYNFARKDGYKRVFAPNSRTGYTFDGWYQKKNYLTDDVISNMITYFHGKGDEIEYKNGILYLTGNYSGASYGFSAPKGQYRISYYSRWQNYQGGTDRGSTFVIAGGTVESYETIKDPLYTDSKNWKKHTTTFTTTGDTIYLYYSQDYGGSEVRDIVIERLDVDDFVGDAYTGTRLCANEFCDRGYGENINFYAKWTEITYTLTLTYDSTTSYVHAPTQVSVSVTGGSSKVMTKGTTWTQTFSYSSFTSSKTISATVTSGSYTYYVSLNSRPTTSSATGSTTRTWSTRTNLSVTLYVYERFTISYQAGYAETFRRRNSGSDLILYTNNEYKIYGTTFTIGYNESLRTGFSKNGWNTLINGTGTSYTNGQSYSTNANLTLYTNWTANYVLMDVTIVTLSETGREMSTQGGTMSAIRVYAPNNQVTSETVTSAYPTLQEYETTITATANTGYVFLGFTTSKANPPKPTSAPDSNTYTFTPPAAGTTTVYFLHIYFKQVSDNQLKWTSEEGGYWYFEDGEYPQSAVTDSTTLGGLNNMSTSTSALYSISYNDGKNVVGIPVYQYTINGITNKYACVEGSGNAKNWFIVEPIRWRVSDYGTSQAQPPSWLQYYGDTMTQVAVSDKILFASAMTPDKIDDSKETSSGTFWLNDYVQNSPVNGLKYGGLEYLILQDKFLKAGGQNIVESELTRKEMTVFANKDITFNSKAKLTAFASFLLYGTTAYADTYDSYWSMDLQIGEQNSQYGCGVVVTSYGKEALQWLNTMCGVRLTYGCSEVSRY